MVNLEAQFKMFKIGLTGNIGAGKTTVAKLFSAKGIPVFYSDEYAREAEKDPQIIKKMLDLLGEGILVNGEIDREKLRSIVFNDKSILLKLTSIISPYINNKFDMFIKKHTNEGKTCVILESAILFEKNITDDFDYIISVIADKETRLQRTIQRDGLSKEMVLAKMENQYSDDYKIENSDFLIFNENTPNIDSVLALNKQVNFIIKTIENVF